MRTPPLILIVEDNPASLEILSARLSANKYDILTATDGQAGLQLATKRHPDLILLDIMMPKMDGIEVCRRIRADDSLPFMPIIMVTAKADSKDVIAGLEAGGDEYLTKPVDHAALVARVKSMLRIKALHDTVVEQSDQLRRQLKTAAKIQSLFWPEIPELAGGSHIWAVSVPAGYVGGDLYDVIPLPDESVLAYVADVSGKGVPAALIMAALSTRIRSEALVQSEVEQLLGAVNQDLHSLTAEEGFFATILLCRYWPANGKLQLVRAGHLPPIWITQSGKSLPELKGISLGVSDAPRYEKKEIALSPGDSILMISDGVIEAENEQNDLFGNERLFACLKESSAVPRSRILLDEIQNWRGQAAASDDITILEIWRDQS